MSDLRIDKIRAVAFALDVATSQMMDATCRGNGLDDNQMVAMAILLAGVIAGRAETTIAGDAESQAVFDAGRAHGRDQVVFMTAERAKSDPVRH